MNHTIESISQELIQEQAFVSEVLHLKIGDCRLDLRSNAKELIDKLHHYFSGYNVISDNNSADINLIAIERNAPELDITFIDWQREPGKTGRKDEIFDLQDARLVRKARTGMVFLQSKETIIAAGPCIKNDNQVINFINSQYMAWLQRQGWIICHASGLVFEDKGIAIAAFSGGGKSTLMLEFMNDQSISYMTNDRLFIRPSKNDASNSGQINMAGIPKLPRINPGTITANPALHSLLSKDKLTTYLAMEKEKLWDIEEKYDVPIKEIYGNQRIQHSSPLEAFIVLNWQRNSNAPVSLTEVNLEERRDLLKAIIKSAGPFYQNKDWDFLKDKIKLDETPYLSMLSGTKIYEAHGGINFSELAELCKKTLM